MAFFGTARCVRILFIAICTMTTVAQFGCVGNRWQASDEGFREQQAVPTPDFGRATEARRQAGLDSRAKDIESSLGIRGLSSAAIDR